MTLGSGNTNGVCPLKLRVPERPIRLRIGRGGKQSREARNLRLTKLHALPERTDR